MAGAAYDPTFYDPGSFDTGGLTLLVGGAALSARSSTVWALQLELASGFPVSYPRTFDAAPARLSSLDLTPDGTPLGANFHEARLLDGPVVVSSGLDEFGGVRDGETLRFRVTGKPPHGGLDLHSWVPLEHRGKPITGWLVDLDPQTLVPTGATQAFRGELVAMADDPATVDLLVRVFDVFALTQTLPTVRVETSWAPYAPATGLGQVVPHGIGIGRRIRCHPVKARSLDDTLTSLTATASAATDILTLAAGYDWQTGDGPLRISSTGTLPAPLLAGVDYFAIAVDQDVQLRLATTRGNALAGTAIDLTSAGTGTLTVASGILPNQDDQTDFVVGVGNVAVCQVWIDGETELPEWPLDYAVVTQEYQADGQYLTVLRLPGDWEEAAVEADVLRVDPDVDGSSTLDLKFCRGFQDDARQWAVEPVGTDTSHLVRGAHRFRLGAWAPPPGAAWLRLPPDAARTPTRSIHAIWSAPALVADGDAVLWADGALTCAWRAATQQLQVTMLWHRAAGDPAAGETLTTVNGFPVTAWSATTGSSTVLAGSTNDLLLRVDGSTGTIDLLLNGTASLTHTKAGAREHVETSAPVVGPMSGRLDRLHVRARLVGDAEHARALRRWQRNGVEWLRELLEAGGVAVDPTAADVAAATWQAVENGALVVDGWLTQETELRSAVLAVAILRGAWFTFAPAGVQVHLPTPTPTLTARLGHGDAYGNLVAMPTRTRASLTEAPRTLQVRFRRTRAAGVGAVEFGQTITRPVFPAGAAALVLDLPFVDEQTAADIVSDWVTKRLIARDQLLRLETGKDARDVAVGDVVALEVPRMGISLAQAEVIGRERGVQHQQLAVVPFATTAFTYTPQVLPPDPLDPFFEPVSLGAFPQLLVSVDGLQVRLEVVPADQQVDRPIGDAAVINAAVPVLVSRMSGASDLSPLAYEVDDDVIDGDTTAIRLQRSVIDGSSSDVEVWFGWPPLPADRVPLSVVIRTTARAGAVDEQITGWGPQVMSAPGFSTITTLVGGAGYLTEIRPLVMTFGLAWSNALVNGQALGFLAVVHQNVYVTRVLREVLYRIPVTRDVHIQYFRAGPDPTIVPPAPTADGSPIAVADDFGPQVDAVVDPGTYWYWAVVSDVVGRRVATVGPIEIEVTG